MSGSPTADPADGAEAVAELERLRGQGAAFLVVPQTALWWLDHYDEFARHLDERYRRSRLDSCEIYDLGALPPSSGDANTMPA